VRHLRNVHDAPVATPGAWAIFSRAVHQNERRRAIEPVTT
jgi:hypothetical protein